jgi:O-antigen biosynthesis protein
MNHNSAATFPLKLTFVLGMHRSGSSALARVLNLAGLRISSQLLPANQDNPSGYWEPRRVVNFNTALLEVFDRH